jgi:hypothetical protein
MTGELNPAADEIIRKTSFTNLFGIDRNEAVQQWFDQTADAIYENHAPDTVAIVLWPYVSGELISKLDDLLDNMLQDILPPAWMKLKEISDAIENSKANPEKDILLPLFKHSISDEKYPYVEVVLNQKRLVTLEFVIQLKLVIDGLQLKIQNGRIKAIESGVCTGKGSLKLKRPALSENITIQLAKVDLPGEVRFSD